MEVLTGEKGAFSIMDYFMHHQVFRNKSVEWTARLLFERNWLQVRLKWWRIIIITDNGKKKCYHCSIVYSVTSSCDTWPRVLLAVRPPRRGQPRYKQQQRRRPRPAKRTQRARHRQKGLHLLFGREESDGEEKSVHCEICRCECVCSLETLRCCLSVSPFNTTALSAATTCRDLT